MALSGAGAIVALGARRTERLESLVKKIETTGGKAIAVPMDIAVEEEARGFIETARKRLGRLDILVNNAGVSAPSPLDGDARADEAWRTILDVNLTGTWRVCRAALPFLADGARVINLSSVTGRFGVAGMAAYCASKHGVIGLTRALALELAPRKITVNAICPGWVETDMGRSGIALMGKAMRKTGEEAFAIAAKMAPLGEVLTPPEIAGLVAYLASDDARNVTGQAIVIDGGQVMP